MAAPNHQQADRKAYALIAQGKALYALGKYERAAGLFLKATNACHCGITVRTRRCACKDLKLGIASNTLKEVLMKKCTCPAKSGRRCDNLTHLDAFDSLAAAYERDGQLDMSLHCAEQMIDLCPREPKGYLRLGKVLRLQDLASCALLAYIQGIELVRKKRPNHALLGKLLEQRGKMRSLVVRLDPMTKFPLELVRAIFKQVDFRTLCRCLCVSKTWKTSLTSGAIKDIWQIQEYRYNNYNTARQPKDAVTQKNFAAYASLAAYKITELSIDSCTRFNLTQTKFTHMVSLTPHLKVLKLHQTSSGLPVLLDVLPTSVTIPQLRKLDLGYGLQWTPRILEQFLAASSDSMEELTIFNYANSPIIDAGTIASWRHFNWPQLPRLKVFRLSCGGKGQLFRLHSLMNRTPNVEEAWIDDVLVDYHPADVAVWQKLKTIFVGERVRLPLAAVHRLPRLNEDMREVHLEGHAFDRFCGCHVPAGHSLLPAQGLVVFQFQQPVVPHLARVEKLSISTKGEMDSVRFEALLRPSITSGSLRELDIRPLPFENVDFKSAELDWLRSDNITFMSLTGFTALGLHHDSHLDRYLIDFIRRFPNLRCLDIEQEVIDDSTLAEFVKMGVETIYHMWGWQKEVFQKWAAREHGAKVIHGPYPRTMGRHAERIPL
ncbi:hypothetical protein F5B20DRAFT_121101 [Whalleya microplaca]|nr:hypothetical protein F5B20DRAFT_121101 [Whalleya microplaca]